MLREELPIIAMDKVTKTYSEGVEALDDITLTISKGEFLFVVGPSGSGKSTFIKLMLKEIEPTKGHIYMNGRDLTKLKPRQISKHRRDIGVVFQNFSLFLNLHHILSKIIPIPLLTIIV